MEYTVFELVCMCIFPHEGGGSSLCNTLYLNWFVYVYSCMKEVGVSLPSGQSAMKPEEKYTQYILV